MAAVDYKQLGTDILANVGGEANVASMVHCATRLRLKLKDQAKADKAAVEQLPGVITVVESGGQFQVVIGNNVPQVYAAIGDVTKLTADNAAADAGPASGNWFGRAVDLISGIFVPILGPLAAVGILKGLLMIATSLHWLSTTDTTYQILWAASDAFFLFLPLVLAVTAARKFGASPFTALALAGALVYTTIQPVTLLVDGEVQRMTLNAWATAGNQVTFLGIPVVMQSYTSTVVPIIFAVWLQSKLEKFFNKMMHESIRNFLTPFFVLVILVPLTLLTIGPAGVWLGNTIAAGLLAVQSFSPLLFGALAAGVWQILVIFGVHWGIVPVFINNIAVQGWDLIKSPLFASNFSQAGAALGVFLRVKDPKQKGISGSAALTAIFGITEPTIYGVTLPRKRPFVIATIAAMIGGGIIGAANTRIYGTGIPSVLTLPIGFGDPYGFGNTFIWLVLGSVIAYVLAAVGTFFFGFSKADIEKDRAAFAAAHAPKEQVEAVPATALAATGSAGGVATLTDTVTVVAPLVGTALDITKVNDKVFASGAMGPGLGIIPIDGRVTAPFDGTVLVSMATGHAVGLKSNDGLELLIHVGVDTVALEGKGFTVHAAQGASVRKGDLLIEADLDTIATAGYDTTTVVVVTNASDFAEVDVEDSGDVDPATTIIVAKR